MPTINICVPAGARRIVNIANLACVDENTGKVVHQNYQGPYKLDIYSNDEHNNWYRGDFYGLDDD